MTIAFISIISTFHNYDHSGLSYISTRIAIISWEIGMALLLCTFSEKVRFLYHVSASDLGPIQTKIGQSFIITIFIIGAAGYASILLKIYWLRDIFAIAGGILFIFESARLITLYVDKIDGLILDNIRPSYSESPATIDDNIMKTMVSYDDEFVNTTVKHCTLGIVGIIVLFIGIGGSIAIPKLSNDERYPTLGYLVMVLQSVIDAFCVYLSFKFGDKLYQKLGCHNCCKKHKILRLEKKLEMTENQDLKVTESNPADVETPNIL